MLRNRLMVCIFTVLFLSGVFPFLSPEPAGAENKPSPTLHKGGYVPSTTDEFDRPPLKVQPVDTGTGGNKDLGKVPVKPAPKPPTIKPLNIGSILARLFKTIFSWIKKIFTFFANLLNLFLGGSTTTPPDTSAPPKELTVEEIDKKFQEGVEVYLKTKVQPEAEAITKGLPAGDPWGVELKRLLAELEAQRSLLVPFPSLIEKQVAKVRELQAAINLHLNYGRYRVEMAKELRSVESANLLFTAKQSARAFKGSDFLKRFETFYATAIPIYDRVVKTVSDLEAKKKDWQAFMENFHKLNDEGLLKLSSKK